MARIVWLLTAVAALAGAAACARISQAEAEASPREALVIWPHDARAAYRLSSAEPERARDHLVHALTLNPRFTPAWIDLGLEAERRGDFKNAEHALIEAARIDRQLQPAWTLANFYFRRADWRTFWYWAERAAERTYDDYRPVVRLALAAPANVEELMARLPGFPVARSLFDVLIGRGELNAAHTVARRLVRERNPEDHPRLAAWVDRLISKGMDAEAAEIWSALEPAGTLSNFDLVRSPSSSGFDWKLLSTPGVAFTHVPGELRIELTGPQPEQSTLLRRTIIAEPDARYRMTFEYRGGGEGLCWRHNDALSETLPYTQQWRSSQWEFTARKPGELTFEYLRRPGTTRMEGAIWLRKLSLDKL